MKTEQLLYGYDDGHGLLAGSVTIDSAKDSARLSMLSDWTGYRMIEGVDSTYITAFPLENSPYYAVAKSWYAQEMERPGCVWTHILLVNLDAIEPLFDFRSLFGYFKRPKRNEYQEYRKSLEIASEAKPSTQEKNIIFADTISVLFLYSTLLKADSPFGLKVEKDSKTNQLFTLTLMQFIPVEVLKKLSFSTGSDNYRKLDKDHLIMMQFVQQGNAVSLVSPPWKEQITEENFNEGLRFLANACINDNMEIAKMIRIFARDIGNDIQKVSAFGVLMYRLYEGIQRKLQIGTYSEILRILSETFPTANEGTMLKFNFLGEKIVSLYCTESDFIYEMCTFKDIEAFKEETYEFKHRVGKLASNQREEYINLLMHLADSDYVNINGKYVMADAFQKLEEKEIVDFSDRNWHAFTTLVMLNPEYLMSGKWITFPFTKFKDMLSCFVLLNHDTFTAWNQLLQRVLTEREVLSQNLWDELLTNTDNAKVVVLDFLNNMDTGVVDNKLVQQVCKNEVDLLEWLKHHCSYSQSIENIVIQYINPTSPVVKKYGSQLWVSFASSDNGKKSMEYYLLLFQLSFLWQNSDSIDLLKHSLYHVHEMLKYNSEEVWNVISFRAAELPFWQEWDKCKKLRKGVVRYLKTSGFSKVVLTNITPNDDLNNLLLEMWSKV